MLKRPAAQFAKNQCQQTFLTISITMKLLVAFYAMKRLALEIRSLIPILVTVLAIMLCLLLFLITNLGMMLTVLNIVPLENLLVSGKVKLGIQIFVPAIVKLLEVELSQHVQLVSSSVLNIHVPVFTLVRVFLHSTDVLC
jgi:hypothetical protein